MTVGERIRQIRKENGLTQVEFAVRLKIGGTSVSKLEKGENNPSDQTVTLICREFGVREAWLRTGEGPEREEQPRNADLESQLNELITAGDDSFRQRLISLLLRLPPEHWAILEHYARELINKSGE